MAEKSFYRSYKLSKLWAYLGILLMVIMNFGPFFSYLTLPERSNANASTTWTKSGSNSILFAERNGGKA